MAECEMVEEPLDLLIPLIALVLDHPLQIRIDHVEVGHFF